MKALLALSSLILSTQAFAAPDAQTLWAKGLNVLEAGTKQGKIENPLLNPVVCVILETSEVFFTASNDFPHNTYAYLNLPEGIYRIEKELMQIRVTSESKPVGALEKYSIFLPNGNLDFDCVTSAAALESIPSKN